MATVATRTKGRQRRRLMEKTMQAPGRVDRAAGVIRDVKILGAKSKNGRTYTAKAMRTAAGMYEGMTVNIDHPERNNPDKERSVNENFGVLRNIKVKESGVYGDLHFLKSHPLAETICERAERFPGTFGLSHNAEGIVSGRDGNLVVEDIEFVRSVDLVSSPATNAGLFESVGNGETAKPSDPAVFGDWLRSKVGAIEELAIHVLIKSGAKSMGTKADQIDDLCQQFIRDMKRAVGAPDDPPAEEEMPAPLSSNSSNATESYRRLSAGVFGQRQQTTQRRSFTQQLNEGSYSGNWAKPIW